MSKMSMTVSPLAAALLMVSAMMLSASPARGGMVITNDGATLVGNVRLVGIPGGGETKVAVQIPGKGLKQLKITDIKTAYLDARGEGSREADGVPWSRTEVGDAKRAGVAEINGNKINIRDSSDGFRIGRKRKTEEGAPTDSCCFVFQKLEGDGEIQGKVLPSELTKWMRGGFMICEGLDGTGPMAFVCRTADPVAGTLLTRLRTGDPILTTPDEKNVNVPAPWLKLSRTGPMFKAFESIDGARWTPIGEKKIAMDESKGIYIGVAATGNSREGTVEFELVKLGGKRGVPGLVNVGDSRLPDICAVLQDGTVLSGSLETVSGADGRLKRTGGEPVTIPVSTMARAQFAPLTRAQTQKFLSAGTGLLTREGDFLDGDIKEVKPDSVTVSSVTFGLTSMERQRVLGLVFPTSASAKPENGLLEIRLSDGSMIVARKITLEKDQLVVDEPLLGTMRVAVKEILSIERRAA
jgi:hypothetical protein